MNRIHQRIV